MGETVFYFYTSFVFLENARPRHCLWSMSMDLVSVVLVFWNTMQNETTEKKRKNVKEEEIK